MKEDGEKKWFIPKKYCLLLMMFLMGVISISLPYKIVYGGLVFSNKIYYNEIISVLSSIGTFGAMIFAAFVIMEMSEQQKIELEMVKEAKEQKEYIYKPKIVPLDVVYNLVLGNIPDFDTNPLYDITRKYHTSSKWYRWTSETGENVDSEHMNIELVNLGQGAAEILRIHWDINYNEILKDVFQIMPKLKTNIFKTIHNTDMGYTFESNRINPLTMGDTLDFSKIMLPYKSSENKYSIKLPKGYLKIIEYIGPHGGLNTDYLVKVLPILKLTIRYRDLSNKIFENKSDVVVLCPEKTMGETEQCSIRFKYTNSKIEEIKNSDQIYL